MSPEQQQQIRDVFSKLIALPQAERLIYLLTACAGQTEVSNEVLRLMESHDHVQSILQPTMEGADDASVGSLRIGRYLIRETLGSGGMGTVYAALDPRLGRKIALKTINVQALPGTQGGLRDRLLREAKAAGALNHPGIVTIHEFDEADGVPFITMELVEGKSLQDLLNAGEKFSTSQVIAIVKQAAAALDYAHEMQILHRDIKPANIMLQPNGIVKIADFGIAKIQSKQLTALTRTHFVVGTPDYMSPEQMAGAPLDRKSDQYSLALTAYRLLTGWLPKPSPFGSDMELSPALEGGPLRRAFKLLPNDRFPTCQGFAEALQQSLEAPVTAVNTTPKEPVRTADPQPKPVPGPPPQPRRYIVPLIAVGALWLAIAGAAVTYLSRRPSPAPMSPVIVRFTATQAGSWTALEWNVSDAARVIIDQGIGKVPASGSMEVNPSIKTKYTLTASGGGVDKVAEAVVEPAPKEPPPAAEKPVIASFRADPPKLAAAGNFRLHWSVKGSSKVSIDQGVGPVTPEGSADRTAGQTTTYTISALPETGGEPVRLSLTVPVDSPRAPKKDPAKLYAEAMAIRKLQPSEAAALLRKAADAGDSRAMLELGRMYLQGDGVARSVEIAAPLLRKASEAGNTSAMVLLGAMYADAKNYEEAVKWFRLAGGKGDKRALDDLADMYLNGHGMPKDPGEAFRLHKQAADAGDVNATFHLGMAYEQGVGVPKDVAAARKMYQEAALLGSREARASLDRIQKVPETLTSASKLDSIEPPYFDERQMRQYKIFGSGLSLQSTVRLNVPGFVGSRQDRPPNNRPVETSSDGTWMKIFIKIDPQTIGKTVRIIVKNPGANEIYLDVPVQR